MQMALRMKSVHYDQWVRKIIDKERPSYVCMIYDILETGVQVSNEGNELCNARSNNK